MTSITVDSIKYGLAESKAKEISDMFKPMLDKMVELEKEYNHVASLPMDPQTCKLAKELRLKYVKTRTTTATIHKGLKEFYLKGGKFVDGWKNAQIMASSGIEENLMSIEKHYELVEKQRIEDLQAERLLEVQKYDETTQSNEFGKMDDKVWEAYISGTKMIHQQKLDAIKKVEEEAKKLELERVAKDKAEAEERERIKKENEELKKAAQEKERLEKIETAKRFEITEKKRLELEAQLKTEREAKEKIQLEAKQKQEKLEREEKAKREKLEAELQAKKDAEFKVKQEEIERVQAELNKGDAAKVKDLVSDLNDLKTKYSFKSAKNAKMYSDVGGLIDKVVVYINK